MLAALALFLFAFSGFSQALVLSGGVSFQANANVTLAGTDSRFDYRHTTFSEALGFAVYTSIQATGSSDGNTASASANGITAVAYSKSGVLALLPGVSILPTLFMCFFNVSASATGLANAGTPYSADITGSLSFVAKAYSKIEEIDTTGAVVATIDLGGSAFTSGGVKIADSDRGLKYLTLSTSVTGGATVAITYAVSSVLGKLADGGATITPTSVESFFEVDSYTYANSANHLRLTLFIGLLSADASASGTSTVVAGSGAQQVYVRFDSSAIVNGQNVAVTVTGIADKTVQVNDVPNTYLRGQLVGHGSLSAEIRKVTVDFPAGATTLTYDPAVGFGAPNQASSLGPCGLFLMVLVAALLFMF